MLTVKYEVKTPSHGTVFSTLHGEKNARKSKSMSGSLEGSDLLFLFPATPFL